MTSLLNCWEIIRIIAPDHKSFVPTHPSDLVEVIRFRNPQLLHRDGVPLVLSLLDIRETA